VINWHDIQVEQEIAQERYEVIVQGRQLAQVQQPATEAGRYVQVRNWLGERLVNWGCQLKVQCNAV
jgi:hypothetical protein